MTRLLKLAFITVCAALCVPSTFTSLASARAGYCQIEIINSMQNDMSVHVRFDDGHPLQPFKIYAHDAPHYISLHYNGYCHSGAHITMEAIHFPHNHVVYDAWTHADSTVHAVPH